MDTAVPTTATVRLEEPPDKPMCLILSGRLDNVGVAAIWDKALALSAKVSAVTGLDRQEAAELKLVVDASAVDYLDSSGFALLLMLRIRYSKHRGECCIVQGLQPKVKALWEKVDPEALIWRGVAPPILGLAEEVGCKINSLLGDLVGQVAFLGQLVRAVVEMFRHRRYVRWVDVLEICRTAGVNAFPIMAFIGFLMGLITAFQSAVPMKRFGADVYVADLLGLSMIRELGPLVTAILLAGRSSSAFAAEIGTMKVNGEIDAQLTMGIDPVRFLAVPRLIAALVVTPVLTVFFNLFALAGGALVVTGFGYALVTYVNRVIAAVRPGDLLGGLFKALVFSLLVAAIGCYRGLRTGSGPTAVGTATTSAVVSGLVLLAVADGILALMFYAIRF